jgi:hypothetical protein
MRAPAQTGNRRVLLGLGLAGALILWAASPILLVDFGTRVRPDVVLARQPPLLWYVGGAIAGLLLGSPFLLVPKLAAGLVADRRILIFLVFWTIAAAMVFGGGAFVIANCAFDRSPGIEAQIDKVTPAFRTTLVRIAEPYPGLTLEFPNGVWNTRPRGAWRVLVHPGRLGVIWAELG